jgi:SAM-dependent methyltransferase
MSSDKRWVLARVPTGGGRALDLGGGSGELCGPLTSRGYEYVNADPAASGPGAVIADAHDLPFQDRTFDLVVSSDSLEHFHTPLKALREVRRVLKPGGTLVIWVPFLHPFHVTDYYRYTPLGLRHLLQTSGLHCVSLEAPLGLFTVYAQSLVMALQRVGLGRLEGAVERAGRVLDSRFPGRGSYAAFYRVTATKPP